MTCQKPENAIPGARGAGGLDFNAYDLMEPRHPGQVPAAMKNGRPVKEANRMPEGVLPAELQHPDAQHALAGLCADVHRGGDHAGAGRGQDARMFLHPLS